MNDPLTERLRGPIPGHMSCRSVLLYALFQQLGWQYPWNFHAMSKLCLVSVLHQHADGHVHLDSSGNADLHGLDAEQLLGYRTQVQECTEDQAVPFLLDTLKQVPLMLVCGDRQALHPDSDVTAPSLFMPSHNHWVGVSHLTTSKLAVYDPLPITSLTQADVSTFMRYWQGATSVNTHSAHEPIHRFGHLKVDLHHPKTGPELLECTRTLLLTAAKVYFEPSPVDSRWVHGEGVLPTIMKALEDLKEGPSLEGFQPWIAVLFRGRVGYLNARDHLRDVPELPFQSEILGWLEPIIAGWESLYMLAAMMHQRKRLNATGIEQLLERMQKLSTQENNFFEQLLVHHQDTQPMPILNPVPERLPVQAES